ncbi:MAG: hydrogenase maturation protease [Xenococcaceae cyanobacterium]
MKDESSLEVVVIGYGNTLRSDDGAGQLVADEVAKWELPNVRSLRVHQLTPELASDIANASTVIFVDAVAPESKTLSEVEIQRLEPDDTGVGLGHTGNPRSLLSLTQAVYGNVPPAYWILIPAVNFDFGEQLSPMTENAAIAALAIIKRLINQQNLVC